MFVLLTVMEINNGNDRPIIMRKHSVQTSFAKHPRILKATRCTDKRFALVHSYDTLTTKFRLCHASLLSNWCCQHTVLTPRCLCGAIAQHVWRLTERLVIWTHLGTFIKIRWQGRLTSPPPKSQAFLWGWVISRHLVLMTQVGQWNTFAQIRYSLTKLAKLCKLPITFVITSSFNILAGFSTSL